MMAVLGFDKESGFNSKCDGKLPDGFRGEKSDTLKTKKNMTSLWRINDMETLMIVRRQIRRLSWQFSESRWCFCSKVMFKW